MTSNYMPGFGNDFESEALPGALPQGQNSPQNCAYGLYAEQLSGSPFTAPRGQNERSWLYRIRPSVRHSGNFAAIDVPNWKTAPCTEDHDAPIAQLRWGPVPLPFSLATLGWPGCDLLVSADVLLPVGNTTGTANWAFIIPQGQPGESLYLQGLAADPNGIVVSNGAALVTGGR